MSVKPGNRYLSSSVRRRLRSKRVLIVLAMLGVAGVSVGWVSSSESLYYRISKSLETYSEVFRRVSMEYVDEVEPEKFVRIGLDAMLASLDPYTVYMDESQSEDFDSQVSGRYVGLGLQVGTYDSILTVTAVTQGNAAERAGIRKGDRLLSVDGTRVLYITPKDLRRYTRGERGSTARVEVLREGRGDTMKFDVVRSEISVRSVTYSARRADNIGVIKLERFTRKTAQEMMAAMDSLRKSGPLAGLILDLRDNPGGLLDAAVSVCELFTKTGSVIVSTKGRRQDETRVYTNNSVPYDTECPMIVLVNKSTASAAEIVAGCLQDLDRAVVCGEQTFGKGLVQSQFPLPYGTTLKLTTQRYYCPSGRCIQRRDYSRRTAGSDSVLTPKSFTTIANRPVADASGITPDTAIADNDLPAAVQEVLRRGLIFKVATQYAARVTRMPQGFDAQELIPELERLVRDQNINPHTSLQKKLEEARLLIAKESHLVDVERGLRGLEAEMMKQQRNFVRSHAKIFQRLLLEEVSSRFVGETDFLQSSVASDASISACADIIRSRSFARFLQPRVATR